MILFISDVHGRFQVINEQIAHAEQHTGRDVAEVIVLGDLGLFTEPLAAFFGRGGGRFSRPVSFLEGNHEEFDRFSELLETYREHLTWLPRGSTCCREGYRFLCLGGSAYMDALNTPPGAEIRDGDIDKCLCHGRDGVDIVLTHDCPCGIGVPSSPGLEFYGPPGFPRSQELLGHFHPNIWIFGHHHKWFQKETPETRFFGLPESWKGYALLDQDFTLTVMTHEVPASPSWWERLVKKWFG